MNRDRSNAPWGSFRRAPVRSTGALAFQAATAAIGRQSFGAWRPVLQPDSAGGATAESTGSGGASDAAAHPTDRSS